MTQTAGALAGINLTAIWIPIALAIISMIIIALYPLLDKDVEDINKKLDASRAKQKLAG
jgi:glycoside/pentoside/hexuronide:cation symporter, GPH family